MELKIVIAFTFSVLCGLLQAGTHFKNKTIIDVGMGWGGEAVYISVAEELSPAEGCSEARFRMPPTTPLFKENFSIILSAFHTGSKVNLYVDGCIGTRMHLKAVGVIK